MLLRQQRCDFLQQVVKVRSLEDSPAPLFEDIDVLVILRAPLGVDEVGSREGNRRRGLADARSAEE